MVSRFVYVRIEFKKSYLTNRIKDIVVKVVNSSKTFKVFAAEMCKSLLVFQMFYNFLDFFQISRCFLVFRFFLVFQMFSSFLDDFQFSRCFLVFQMFSIVFQMFSSFLDVFYSFLDVFQFSRMDKVEINQYQTCQADQLFRRQSKSKLQI